MNTKQTEQLIQKMLDEMVGAPFISHSKYSIAEKYFKIVRKEGPGISPENAKYLIKRLERDIELIHDGEGYMAVAKLLADISALKGYL